MHQFATTRKKLELIRSDVEINQVPPSTHPNSATRYVLYAKPFYKTRGEGGSRKKKNAMIDIRVIIQTLLLSLSR